MELRRLGRAAADRWATIAVVGLIGLIAAVSFNTLSTNNATEVYSATAALRFVPAEGQTIADLADELIEAQALAQLAANSLLQVDSTLLIAADFADARLLFVAEGGSPEEAEDKARGLLQSYLDVDPTAGGSVDELLAEIVAQAGTIQTQIDELDPPQSAAESQALAELAQIDAGIAAINGRLTELVLADASPSLEVRTAAATERASLNTVLQQLVVDRAGLVGTLRPEITVADQLLLTTLQQRLVSLQAEYQRLYLRKLGVTGEGGPEPVSVVDLTPEPLNPWAMAAAGLLGGLLVAVATIVFVNRTRKTVWLPEDINLPVLGEVPARKVALNSAEAWYDTAEPGTRKEAIQALRSSVEAQLVGDGTIAITGHDVLSEGVQALAADLAASMASAGTSVLLIDANFQSRSPLGRYVVGGSSVATVLGLNPTLPEFDAEVRNAVESAYMVRSGLKVMPSGPPPLSPADALAGRQFRQLIRYAQEECDVVIAVVDEIDTSSGQVALQRLSHGLLVLTPGSSTSPAINGLLSDTARLGISMLGAAFLDKREGLFTVLPRPWVGSSPAASQADGDASTSPISRLHNYPAPEQRSTAVISHSSLDELRTHVGGGEAVESSELGMQLLEAINTAGPEQAYESVSEYLVSQMEDMALARYGYGGLSDELIDHVAEYGFLSLRQLRGMKTPSAWLSHEIESEVDSRTAFELTEALERTLGHGTTRQIDDWLAEEFFIRHLERTDGEPSVWHLTSPEGNVSVILPARRIDTQRLEMLVAEVVKREIADLERFRRATLNRGDHEQADAFEGQIHDVRQFEHAVLGLMEPSRGKSRDGVSWNPDWSKGTRFNLAPLQAAGLLPFQVLSDEEVASVQAGV